MSSGQPHEHAEDDSASTNSVTPGERTPLLGSPRSRNKKLVLAPTPLPVGQLTILWFVQLCEPISSTVIYPFVNHLIHDIGITRGDKKKMGYYVGLVESVFFVTECLSILIWTNLSDSFGRRPIILAGLLGVAVATLCFGLSETFATLMLSRALVGALNGNIGVIKGVIGEITDDTNMAAGLQYMPLAWPIGETIGPLIGGYLAHPSKLYHRTFGGVFFWKHYPYFLPCVATAAVVLLAWLVTLLFLKETHPTKTPRHRRNSSVMSLNTRLRLALSTSQSTSDAEKKVSHLSLLKTPRVAISILNYSLFALIDISFAALQPLFFATPIHLGGLGLPPSKIGPILAVDGVMNGLVLLLFNRLTKRWGVKRVYVWSVAAFVILFGTFPAMNLLVVEGEPMGWKVWAVLGIQLALTGMPSIGYGCLLIFINASSPSRALLGATNGLAQTSVSFMRAVGPIAATSLFAFSIERNLESGRLVFWALIVCSMVGIGAARMLKEDEEDEEVHESEGISEWVDVTV